MGCMPESGGCERHRTDPFVHHLNAARGTTYSHEACLDHLHRNTPQPEALYSDQSGSKLVIERKTVVWPTDYAAKHRNDHFIADELAQSLRGIAVDTPLSIHLEPATLMLRSELSAFAHDISDTIKASLTGLREGQVIGSSQIGRRWQCILDPAERAACDQPSKGLIVHWTSRDEQIDPANLPSGLTDQICHCFGETVKKFNGYPKAKGILLLDPHGSIRYTGATWWTEVLSAVLVPSGISEIWTAMYDWITDTEQGWLFQQVYPAPQRLGAV